MGSVISCGLKLVLQVFNLVLFVAFMAVAVFGIVLRTSSGLVQSIVEKVFDKSKITDEQVKVFAQFITDNSGGVAAALIVIGLALAALCLLGCIASCCGFELLLKIYAAILIVLLVVQIILVAVVFSDPNRVGKWVIESMSELLRSYDDTGSTTQNMPTTVWNLVMSVRTEPHCCAMDGYEDIVKPHAPLVPFCCADSTQACDDQKAKQDRIKGCRQKIADFTAAKMKSIMYIAIVAILFQDTMMPLDTSFYLSGGTRRVGDARDLLISG
ncbi:unnamed protein product [Hydatigera taeniaeformis]|uniref:Tetraspanin n=1 Tax=Hydatigena taeniaeformis TaxID=6205 RepID=A0A0R3X913_HYDTA|nr:unnamed protein product [Hydatigera taeniaeformis]